ncbi:DEAD-box ATP-dependent RNA helicase 39 [Cornus florida]|uniref:DEAD-box ATP-dependent RNA helicase 39 n=1 Tax=Cornus florida TaxID=4283 RepID=UPI00289D2A9B|nr:DEAD-box ATP-dependent RNA helicase 39 [Cornus florida]
MGGGGTLLSLSLSSSHRFSFSLLSAARRLPLPKLSSPPPLLPPQRVFLGFRPICSTTSAATTTTSTGEALEPIKHSILLEKLRIRHVKDSTNTPQARPRQLQLLGRESKSDDGSKKKKKKNGALASSFEELGLSEEVMGALEEMGISVPTEIQSIGIPAVLGGNSVALRSHTGSGKTLAYMLPLVQLLRRDEALSGMLMKPRRPRAVILCPTRELSEQVFRVAKSISHHARFRSTMVSGGSRLRPQEDSLNAPVDLVVGTPGRVLQHIEEGNIVYGDVRYLVLDEADTMFDHGFGPDIRKFLSPLRNRASKHNGQGFQTVLVAATMTKAVQKLVDEEFQGIEHLCTSTLHKKIVSAHHDFIKLSGSENKMESLLQVLEPSLAKGNRVMVFCNTLNSSRAVDHFLSENQISTVNYHGEVPAEQRVENLNKFKSEDGDCPTLVCTDLAARGLDMDVDHVIMFDFPMNSIDYLHRTGRTARMGAKGKVTSLVTKRDAILASRIEEAIMKNESLESVTADNVRRDIARSRINGQKGQVKDSNQKNKTKAASVKSSSVHGKVSSAKKVSGSKYGKVSVPSKPMKKAVKMSKPLKSSGASSSKRATSHVQKQPDSRKYGAKSTSSKLNVVGFRGRNSSSKESLRVS